MFKKEIQISSKHQLSGKDKDKLRTKLGEYYDKETIEYIFSKKHNIWLEKVKNGTKSIISTDDLRVFIDSTNK